MTAAPLDLDELEADLKRLAPAQSLYREPMISLRPNKLRALIAAARERDALKAERDAVVETLEDEQAAHADTLNLLARKTSSLDAEIRVHIKTCDENAALRAKLALAEKALEPFAKEAEFYEKCDDRRPGWATMQSYAAFSRRSKHELIVADFRRARTALAAIRPTQGEKI